MDPEEKTTKEEEMKQEDKTSNVEDSTKAETDKTSENQIKELEEKLEIQHDKYLRLYSEFDNFRKRTSKERIDLIHTAGIEIITNLLPVIDDLERAIKSSEQISDTDAFKEGINLIYNKLINTLSKKGLEPMKSIGEPFDPEFHEAVTNIPAPSEDMIGKVVDEVEKGYLLNGKVIRYAKVVVGN